MNNKGKLFFFCGKMGAGKSTTAKVIAAENHAVLISEDEWLAAHFPAQITSFDDYLKYANLIKPFVRKHVQALLNIGTHVVMDFPANTVKQRTWFLSLCGEVGSEHQLLYLDVTDAQCLAQIGQRRLEQPERANFDTEAVFHYVSQFFEVPNVSEGLNIVTVGKPL